MWIKHARQLTSNKAVPVRALDSLSFHIDRGEIIINGFSDRNKIKDQISYISTNGWMGLEWQLTVRENLHLYGQIFGLSRSEIRERSEFYLKEFGLLPSAEKNISQLSAGMRQKITLARGFMLDRPLIYLDEPTVSLDVPSSTALRDLLVYKASEEVKTILLASHNEEDLTHCHRILMLSLMTKSGMGNMAPYGSNYITFVVLGF